MRIVRTPRIKRVKYHVGENHYNYVFNYDDGYFARWGEHQSDDPDFSPVGPEIADIEISTICHQGCSFCYKSNTAKGDNMTLEQFKDIFHKLPKNVCQIAFGIGSIDANPDLWQIMNYCRFNDYNKVVPNITINGYRMTDHNYRRLAMLCGAVAVSNYGKDVCYGAVQHLTHFVNMYKQGAGQPGPANDGITLRQVNIHQMLCEETFDTCMELIDDIQTDPRLKDLNAVVFLIMKPKGSRNKCHQMKDLKRYRTLIDKAFAAKVRIGFDSCTAPSFLRAVHGRPEYQQLKECAEPCESTCFSIYIDVHGNALPCSFCGGEPGVEPINMMNVTNFMHQVWWSKQFTAFRRKLLTSQEETGCRQCPMFDVEIR